MIQFKYEHILGIPFASSFYTSYISEIYTGARLPQLLPLVTAPCEAPGLNPGSVEYFHFAKSQNIEAYDHG